MSTTGEAGRLSSGAASNTSVSLDAVIAAPRRLDELSTARVICEAAEAIHKAQKGGQPVATVSPRMILVTREGIALDLMAPTSVAYHAPEKVEGKPGDRRTDVFSLGVILWEALAHERLFDGANDEAIKKAILTNSIAAPSELNANVPAELDAIVKKALARDPAERFPSAKVMAAELSTILDDAGYPDSHEEIEKYLAAEFPAGAVLASKLAATPAGSGPIKAAGSASMSKAALNQTVLGMAPIRDPAIDKAAEKAAAEKLAAEAAAAKAAVEKAAAEKAAAEKAAAEKLAAEAAQKAAAEKAAADKAAAEKKAADAKAAADKAAADKKAAEAKAAADKAAAEKAAAEKKAAEAKAAADKKAAEARAQADKKAAEAKAAAEKAAEAKAAAEKKAAEAKAAAEKAAAEKKAAEEKAAADKAAASAKKSEAAKTLALGSLSHADLAPKPAEPVPAPPVVAAAEPAGKTKAPISQAETLATPTLLTTLPGVGPISDKTEPQTALPASPSGIVGLPAMPPGASEFAANDDFNTSAGAKAFTSIDEAVSAAASQPMPAAAAPVVEPQRPSAPKLPEAAQVVSLPRTRSPTAPGEPLSGWFSSTDSHASIDDDHYEEDDPKRVRRKKMIIVGGSVAAAFALIAVIAMAMGGGGKKKEQDKEPPKDEVAEGAPSRTAAEPAPTPTEQPAVVDPGSAAVPAVDPAAEEAAKAEAAKAEAAKAEEQKRLDAEAAKAAAAKAEEQQKLDAEAAKQAKLDAQKAAADDAAAKKAELAREKQAKLEQQKADAAAAKQAKLDAQKAAAAKAAADKQARLEAQRAEAAKNPPPKKEPRKKEPKVVAATNAAPVDPYAAPKTDPAAAYKTGFQQYVRGDTSGALATFKGAQSANPGYAPTYRGLGLVYEKMGNKTAAKLAFKRYLQLSPNAGDAEQIKDRMEKLGS